MSLRDLKNPMGIFNTALANGQIANFNFIHSGCEDGEANCGPGAQPMGARCR